MTKITKQDKSNVIINTCFGGKNKTYLLLQNNIKNNVKYTNSKDLILDLVSCVNLNTSINEKDQIVFNKINECRVAEDAIENKHGKLENKPFSIYKRFYQTINTNFDNISDEKINEYFIIACKYCEEGGIFTANKNNIELTNILNNFITSKDNKRCYKDLKLMIDYANINVNQYDFSNLFHNFNKNEKLRKFETIFNQYHTLLNETSYGIIKNNNIETYKKDDFDLSDKDNILNSISNLEKKLEELKTIVSV